MKLEISLDRELEVMSEYNLTGEEWMFLRVLFIAVEEQKLPYLQKYLLECAKSISVRELLQSLKTKKIIAQSYQIPEVGEAFEVEDVEFHQPFMNKAFKVSNSAGIELMRNYPAYMSTASGTLLNLRNIVSKGGYIDEDDFYFQYAKKIKFSRVMHEQILQALEWGKEQDLIKYSIVEFVASSKWNELAETMNAAKIGNFVTKMDTIEVL